VKPSFAASTARIFELSLGHILWARRTLFLAVITGGPVLLAVATRLALANGTALVRVNGARVDSATVFNVAIWTVYLRFIVPALGVFYGASLIADEVEDKTITYLFTRPIRRGAVVLGEYLAYLVHVLATVLPSVAILFVLMVPFGGMATVYVTLVKDLGVIALGLAAYGALFLLAGVVLKRPLVAGLVFAFGWEPIALAMPGYLRHLTVAYYLQALSPRAIPVEDTFSVLQTLNSDLPSAAASVLALAVTTVVTLILAMRTVERREYVLEQ
jgi:ABC-type transport system involved in multi-copper enzyme maturation permease subunit